MPYKYANAKLSEEDKLKERIRFHEDLKNGKSSAFEHVARTYRYRLENKYPWGFSNEEQEELFQDALMGLWRSLDRGAFTIGTNHFGFLKLTYKRKAVTLYKKKLRKKGLLGNEQETINYDEATEEEIDKIANQITRDEGGNIEPEYLQVGEDNARFKDENVYEDNDEIPVRNRQIQNLGINNPITPDEIVKAEALKVAIEDCKSTITDKIKRFIADRLYDIDDVFKQWSIEQLMEYLGIDYENKKKYVAFRQTISRVEKDIRECLIGKGFGPKITYEQVQKKLNRNNIQEDEIPLAQLLIKDLVAKKRINIQKYLEEFDYIPNIGRRFNNIWKEVLAAARRSINDE